MKHHRRLGISSAVFIIITLVCIFTVFGLCLLLVSSAIGGSEEKVESTQRRLLYATNPAALMAACKELAKENARSTDPVYPDATSSLLPAIIRKVRPKTISIDNGRVTLECGTNAYRFGLMVDIRTPMIPTTRPARPATRPISPMATRQLAPGVWYYAQDHAVPGP
jgi:hypothetical protein